MRPIWLVIFGMLTLLLRVGFALQASGSLRAKNASAAIVRSIAETAAAALAFWVVGAAILFQNHSAWIGINGSLLLNQLPELATTEFFHMTLCLIGTAIVSGALAERSRFHVGVIASAVLAGFVFPVAGHWIWFGKLRDWNFIDFGGATAIHLAAAVFAAVGVAVIGSRSQKYNTDRTSNSIAGHSLPMMGLGVLLLFVGWFPYLLGCVAAHWAIPTQLDDVIISISAANILLAGSGGVVGALIYSQYRFGKPDLFFICSGLLGALVAISPGLPGIGGVGSVVIGIVAGILVPIVAAALDEKARLDDPIGLISIHGTGAIWGTLATAFFVSTGNYSDHFKLLAIQCAGVAMVIVLASIVSLITFASIKHIHFVRSEEIDESNGMDRAEHGVISYPEFEPGSQSQSNA